jgi:ribosome production factor 1
MGSGRGSSGGSLSLKTSNKLRRKQLYVEQKKKAGKSRHEERHRRRRDEAKDPELRRERLERNQPASIDKKRIWDDVDDDSLGAVVDVAQLKRRRLEAAEAAEAAAAGEEQEHAEKDDDVDSMLGSDEEGEDDEDEGEDEEERREKMQRKRAQREPSIAPSATSTNLELTPDALAAQFKYLFSDEPPAMPKILVTTGINGTIHKEAQDFASIFPNGACSSPGPACFDLTANMAPATYIRRSAHRYGHKYSVREIAKFAKSQYNSSHGWPLGRRLTSASRSRIHCVAGGSRRPKEAEPAQHLPFERRRCASRSDAHLHCPELPAGEVNPRPRQRHQPLCERSGADHSLFQH